MSIMKSIFSNVLFSLLMICLSFTGLSQGASTPIASIPLQKVLLMSDVTDILIPLMKDHYIPLVSSQEKEVDFYKLWEHLGALKSLEDKVDSLYTLTEVKEQPHLLAIHVVAGKVMETACKLMETSYELRNCNYDSLRQLKLEIDIHNTLKSISTSAKNLMKINSIPSTPRKQQHDSLVLNMFQCLLSPTRDCNF